MNINWKVRFKNKAWVTAFCAFVLSTVYQFLTMFGVTIPVPQETVADLIAAILQILGFLGLIQDPTTAGLSDSDRAMKYTEPNKQ